MSTRKHISQWIAILSLGGWKGVLGVSVVAVLAFILGAMLFGNGDLTTAGQPVGPDHAAETDAGPTIWTCSMHPQIKLPKAGKCPICFMDLIPLETGSSEDLGPRQIRLSESAKQLARIQTTRVAAASAEAAIRLVGKITYDESKLAYISAWVPGRLDRLYADYTGIAVGKGDPLVKMYSPELISAQEELIQALVAIEAL
ncbi:MAG: efflux RND transporter periplasmic adaptor subunit, partial [Candidatus Latescibacterota bacterium]